MTCKERRQHRQPGVDGSVLREHGYRLTDARKAVVDVVANSQCLLRPAEVFDIARRITPGWVWCRCIAPLKSWKSWD